MTDLERVAPSDEISRMCRLYEAEVTRQVDDGEEIDRPRAMRAALQALMDPSERMLNQGATAVGFLPYALDDGGKHVEAHLEQTKECWQAMLQSILTEGS